MDTLHGFHFLADDGCLRKSEHLPRIKVEAGQVVSLPDAYPVRRCRSGLHFCREPMDALRSAPGSIVCYVEGWGDVQEYDNEVVCRHRRCLAIADVSTLLHEFACDEAERALLREYAAGGVPFPESLRAINAKRQWLRGEISDKELKSADAGVCWSAYGWAYWAANRAAYWAAYWGAHTAADKAAYWAAYWGAHTAADGAADWSANTAADGGAHTKERVRQNAELRKRLFAEWGISDE